MKRRFVVWAVFGVAMASGMTACGYRQSVPVNHGMGETAHARRYLVDVGRTPAEGSRFHLEMMSTSRVLTDAKVGGQLKERTEEKTVVEIEADADVLAATAKGITKARYTMRRLLVDGREALPLDTVVAFDRDAVNVLTIGEDAAPVPAAALPALALMVAGLEPLNDEALVGLSRRQSVGTTWRIDSLAAAVEFEKGGINVDPDEIDGRSHFSQLTELDGVPSMTIQSELKLDGARPKRPAQGAVALPGSYEVKSEITVPVRVGDATLRDERSRTHSVVQVRTPESKTEAEVLLTLTTTANQSLRIRPLGDGEQPDAVGAPLDNPNADRPATGADGGVVVPVDVDGAESPADPGQSPDTGWGPETDEPPRVEPIWDPSRTGPNAPRL